MWSRTWVPNHRPRWIGDHIKGSVIIGHPRRVADAGRKESRMMNYTLTAAKTTRNAPRLGPFIGPSRVC